MKRTALCCLIILALGAPAMADTFRPLPYVAESGVDVLNRTVANQQLGRDLFGRPYATVVVGHVDVYDGFPYLEARHFQIVSDPAWNRLLLGEAGKAPVAYDGTSGPFDALSSPRGMAVDERGRLYVADSGNDRVVVFQTATEFDRISLVPLYAIDGLHNPYDVAYSDAGTPFDEGDDRLYVANTGRNEVRRYDLSGGNPQLTFAIGDLGSGSNRFAGPMSITVGHRDGVHSNDVYVADAHNGRIVRLVDNGSALVWSGEAPHGLGMISSLESDHWGNVYAAAPQVGTVAKLTPSLVPVASLVGEHPKSFHVPFVNYTDHRNGERSRIGEGNGVLVEDWNATSGMRLMGFGVDMSDVTALENEGAAVRLMLTDNADVQAEIVDPQNGAVIARHDAGLLEPGEQTIRFSESDFVANWERGDYQLVVRATSTYSDGVKSEKSVGITMSTAGGPPLPEKVLLMGNSPNPFNPVTVIRFAVPAGPDRAYTLRVYDVAGRLVRTLGSGRIPGGHHNVTWDGMNEKGAPVGSGIYLYRLDVGADNFTGKMVLVK